MMKKGFTLIEIVITIVIIGLVLAMVTNLGSGFSDKIRFANTKESFASSVQNVIQEAATTNAVSVSGSRLRYGSLYLGVASGNILEATYASGELMASFSRAIMVERAVMTTSGFSILLTPYKVGCEIQSGASLYITSTENASFHACYSIQSTTCKFQEVQCSF